MEAIWLAVFGLLAMAWCRMAPDDRYEMRRWFYLMGAVAATGVAGNLYLSAVTASLNSRMTEVILSSISFTSPVSASSAINARFSFRSFET